jgi:hypothetical protein
MLKARWFLIVAPAALALFAAGCGGSGGGGGDEVCAPSSVDFVSALELIAPGAAVAADEEQPGHSLFLLDQRRVYEAAGVGRPGSLEEWVEALEALTPDFAFSGTVWGYSRLDALTVGETLDQYGIQLWEMDLLIENEIPGGALGIALGDFDGDGIRRALVECEGCLETPAEVEVHGATALQWGNEAEVSFDAVLEPPVYDRLGRGSLVLPGDSVLVRSLRLAEMDSTVAACGGEESLADDETFRLLAEAMESARALNPYITTAIESQRSEPGNGTLLVPYLGFAAGQGFDDDGVYLTIALVHQDEAAATENVERLQERIATANSVSNGDPWSERFTDVEVTVEGRVTIATLRGIGAARYIAFYYERDPLLGFEE